MGLKLRPFCFQDDILKVNKTKTEAQLTQKVIYDTVSSKTLEFNLDKCTVLIHGKGMLSKLERSVYASDPVLTGPAITPLVTKDKYLGDTLHETDLNECFRETVKSRIPKVKGAIAEIMAVVEDIKATNLQPIRVGLDLWNKVVLPMVLYNSNPWIQIKEKDYSVIETLQYDFLRRLLQAPKHTLRAGILWETGQWPMRMRIMMSKIMLYRHLVCLPVSSVAKQIFDAETYEIEGLKFEVTMFCHMNSIPLPTVTSEKDEYRKLVTKRLEVVIANELRSKLAASSNMAGTERGKFEIQSYMQHGSLGFCRQLFAYRVGTTTEFVGNRFGQQINRLCLCGRAFETSSHITRCALYSECEAGLRDRVNNFSECMLYWDRVVEKKRRLLERMPRPTLDSSTASRSDDSS